MYELVVVYRNIRRADGDIAIRLGAFGTATVLDMYSMREPLKKGGLRYID